MAAGCRRRDLPSRRHSMTLKTPEVWSASVIEFQNRAEIARAEAHGRQPRVNPRPIAIIAIASLSSTASRSAISVLNASSALPL